MEEKPSQNNQIPPVFIRMVLLVLLLKSGAGVYAAVVWVYQQVHTSLGLGLAQVVVAFLSILILFLILLGFGAGFSVERFAKRRKIRALMIYRLLRKNWILRSVWGYVAVHDEGKTSSSSDQLQAEEMKALLNRPKRRGRPPTHSIDRWRRVVLAWENRDPLHNTLTLTEFLSQEFGIYADGSPRMSENSYYDWRKRVFEELYKQEAHEKQLAA